MEDNGPHHDGQKGKSYVLTFDLGEKVKLLRSVGLKTPDSNDPFYTEVRTEIVKKFKTYLPGVKIIDIATQELAEEIVSRAVGKKRLLQNGIVVSTCLEIAISRRGVPLEINRIIDQEGKILGIGPRPGYPSVDEQINGIHAIASGQPIILVEDGSFTGNTIVYIVEKLQQHQLTIATIVIGFAFPRALKRIKEVYNGEIIIVEEVEDYIDWMPDHDFFPFTPNCGRVLGLRWNKNCFPFYTYNGASYSVPYLHEFCPVNDWTNIPQHYTKEFSSFCAWETLKLFNKIECLSKEDIKIGDLMAVRPRISIPLGVGEDSLPNLETRVSSYLSDLCQKKFM